MNFIQRWLRGIRERSMVSHSSDIINRNFWCQFQRLYQNWVEAAWRMIHSRVFVMEVCELNNQFAFICAFYISLNPKKLLFFINKVRLYCTIQSATTIQYRLYYSPTAPLLTRWCSIRFHSFIDDELVRINPRLVIPALILPLSASTRNIFILLSIPSLYLIKGFLTYKELVRQKNPFGYPNQKSRRIVSLNIGDWTRSSLTSSAPLGRIER